MKQINSNNQKKKEEKKINLIKVKFNKNTINVIQKNKIKY